MSKRWAVLIGVNGYHESLGALRFCVNDARLMQETLTSECCAFPQDNVVLLTDEQPKDRLPTFGNIHSWLGTWLSRPGPDDLVLVYFAGHGREAKDQALLVPQDATLESLPVTGIPIQYIRDLLDRCRARQKVFILDACHSGAGRDVATMGAGFRHALDAGKGLYTIASCDADQISYEWPEKKHGVFTHYLVEAIRHGAPVGTDGQVALDRVYESTRSNILAWTAGKRLKQEPVRICRTKGEIHIASRSLSLEQQLEIAQDQTRSHLQMIDKLQQEVSLLEEENGNLLEKNAKEPKKGLGKRKVCTGGIAVKKWREWVGSRGPYDENSNFQLWGLMTMFAGPAGGLLVGLLLFGAVLGVSGSVAGLAAVIAGLICGPGLAWLIWLMIRRAWKNKYCLYCLHESVKGGDYVGASAYAHSMGRLGVDLGSGAAAVCRAAELAADNEDFENARSLYLCASHV